MSSSAPRWRAVPIDALAWREWSGEVVVRNERTGSTHLLAPLAGSVLKLLCANGAGLSVDELETGLRDSPPDDLPQAGASVEAVLEEFRRLGLAEPDTP